MLRCECYTSQASVPGSHEEAEGPQPEPAASNWPLLGVCLISLGSDGGEGLYVVCPCWTLQCWNWCLGLYSQQTPQVPELKQQL